MSRRRASIATLRKDIIALLALAIALAGCDKSLTRWFESFAPKAEVDFAKQTLALFQSKDFDTIEARADPRIVDAQFRSKIEEVATLFPEGTPKSVKITGWEKFTRDGAAQATLGLEYEFPDTWLLASVIMSENGEKLRILGVQVTLSKTSVEERNRFGLENKSPLQYAVLGLAILVPILIVATSVMCIRTPIPRRKWLWLIFIALGIGQLHINWTTGAWAFDPIAVQLLGAGFNRPGLHGPVLLHVSLPLGAALFLLRRRAWLRAA